MARKQRILWPAGNEKTKYNALEEIVLKKMKQAVKEAEKEDKVIETEK